MPPPEVTPPPQPLPKAVQNVILVVFLGLLAGLFYMMRERAPEMHGVHDALAYQGTGTFEVSGDVAPSSEADRALRAMDGYDSFTLRDATGQMTVYFASDVSAPAPGAHVVVEGHKLPIAGVGAMALLATGVRTAP